MTKVKISCPCGLKWTWQAVSPDGEGKEARALDWIQKCTANFRTYSLRVTLEGLEIKLETLTHMLPLLQATQNPPPELGSRSLVYDSGPWKGANLLVGIESFFQKSAYHPFAICGNLECGKTGPIPLSTISHKTHPEQTPPATTDPTKFRSNRHHIRDRTFLDKAGIFDFWTIPMGRQSENQSPPSESSLNL